MEYNPKYAGERNSLTVRLKKKQLRAVDKCLINAFIVHSPFEHPLSYKDYEFCEFSYGTALEVLIEPEVIVSDEYLKHYSKEKRRCIFEDENEMKFYKIFTQKNCEMECLSALVIKACKCVPYFFISDGRTPICTIQDMECVRYWELWTLQKEEGYDLEKLCNCFPPCNSIKYNFNIITKKLKNETNDEITITFKFKDSYYTPLKRHQLFTVVDFVSQCGGILGLFSGISFLSVIELFYLIVIRKLSDALKTVTTRQAS